MSLFVFVVHERAFPRSCGEENLDSHCVSRFLRFSSKGGGPTKRCFLEAKRLAGFLAFLAFPHQNTAKKRNQTCPMREIMALDLRTK
jgi:hypothetical protein